MRYVSCNPIYIDYMQPLCPLTKSDRFFRFVVSIKQNFGITLKRDHDYVHSNKERILKWMHRGCSIVIFCIQLNYTIEILYC